MNNPYSNLRQKTIHMNYECPRQYWANASKERVIEELKNCVSVGSKPSKYCELRIIELLGGKCEERKTQTRKCSSCAYSPINLRNINNVQ